MLAPAPSPEPVNMRLGRILITQNDPVAVARMRALFSSAGFEMATATVGEAVQHLLIRYDFEAAVLDTTHLEGPRGERALQDLRARGVRTPILLLAPADANAESLLALHPEADDCLTGACSAELVVARVRALVRLWHRARLPQCRFRVGTLLVDLGKSRVEHEGQRQHSLTPLEVSCLRYLVNNRHRPVTRQELLREVWEYPDGARVETRTVDNHMVRLRQKVESDPRAPELLVTVHGGGYRFMGQIQWLC